MATFPSGSSTELPGGLGIAVAVCKSRDGADEVPSGDDAHSPFLADGAPPHSVPSDIRGLPGILPGISKRRAPDKLLAHFSKITNWAMLHTICTLRYSNVRYIEP